MEPILTSEEEWSSLSNMFAFNEADFMSQLHDPCSSFIFSSNIDSSYLCELSQGNNSNGGSGSSPVSYYASESDHDFVNNSGGSMSMSMEFCLEDAANIADSYIVEVEDCSNGDMSNHNAEKLNGNHRGDAFLPEEVPALEIKPLPISESSSGNLGSNPTQNTKKRAKNAGEVKQKKRNVRAKKSQEVESTSNHKEENIAGLNGPGSSSCCTENDGSNPSQDLAAGANSSLSPKGSPVHRLNGKTRASRGAATDPQSLYARKRRERISERLRILQNLVPNGTKVDISTMLEEAMQYVKFLQLQIKILSSDDLWMYAPIAYNGINIGLDLKSSGGNLRAYAKHVLVDAHSEHVFTLPEVLNRAIYRKES